MWSGSFVQVDNALSSATNGQPNATPAVGLPWERRRSNASAEGRRRHATLVRKIRVDISRRTFSLAVKRVECQCWPTRKSKVNSGGFIHGSQGNLFP